MKYCEWEDEITTILERECELTRSDAQGVVEAQPFILNQCWARNLPAEIVAKYIDAASRGEPVEINGVNGSIKHAVTGRRQVPNDSVVEAVRGKKAICVRLTDGRMAWGYADTWEAAESAAVIKAKGIKL
jgi:hypothetical protein